jgi:hypothetical protein
MKRQTAIKLIEDELERAQKEFPAFHSGHEGYAVLKEELEELWEEIKAGRESKHEGISEAVQTAAMALRFLIDLCDEKEIKKHEIKIETHYNKYDSYGGYSG